jgi:hypothetical protein
VSPETASRIQIWRQRARDGTLTEADMAEAIAALRGERQGAAIASDTSRRKNAKAAVPDAESMLAELGVKIDI